jgi:hypothetical protein
MSNKSKPPSTNSRRKARTAPKPTLFDHLAGLTDEALGLLEELCSVERSLSAAEAKLERALARAVPREAKKRQNKNRAGAGNTHAATSAQSLR